MSDRKVVAFDTETRGLNWFERDEQAFLGTWADETGEWHADLSDPEQGAKFLSALAQADVLVAHNLSFDVHQVRASTGLDILSLGKELHDTDLLARVLLPEAQFKGAGGYKLKKLADRYLGDDSSAEEDAIKEMAKSIGLRTIKAKGAYYEVWKAYPEVMEAYARQDARITWDLFAKFYPKLQLDERARRIYELEMAVAPVIIEAEARGVAVDQERVTELHKEYTKLEREQRAKLERELGAEALGGEGSEEALLEALLKQGVPLYRKTPSGAALSTNKFALEEFEDDFPVLGELMEWRRVTRFLSTYLGPAVGRDVVHTSFMQCEAKTGRMSSRRPNMQNVPKASGKEVREIFVPRPGCAFVVADFESIEVRLLAYYLGTYGEPYTQLIEDGHDPHAYMAAQIWGGQMEDYLKGTAGEDKRGTAKNVTFAITYGAGVPRVMDMTKLDRSASQALIAKIKGALPGYYKLTKDRIQPKIRRDGHVHTMFGRKQVVNKDKSYVGLNALIQGSAADVFKQAVVNVADALRPIGWQPILFVHDEVVCEGPQDRAEEAETRVRAAMVSAADFRPRLTVTSKILTTNYGDA